EARVWLMARSSASPSEVKPCRTAVRLLNWMTSAWSFGPRAPTSRRAAARATGSFGSMEAEVSIMMTSERSRRRLVNIETCCSTPSSRTVKSPSARSVMYRLRPSVTQTLRLMTSTAEWNTGGTWSARPPDGPPRSARTRAIRFVINRWPHHNARGLPTKAESSERRIRIALVLTLGTMVASVVGGLASRSLALLSDAGHMLADAGALGLALVAQRVAARPRTSNLTYGSRRAETLAAFVNAIVLCITSIWVIVEAVERWKDPPEIQARWMLAVAVGGLVVNLVAARILSADGHGH